MRTLIRVDLNIPLDDAQQHPRLREAVEAARHEIRRGQVVLLSHRGRPKGRDKMLSLKPFIPLFERALRLRIAFLEDPFKPSLREKAFQERVILIENLRFWQGEEANSDAFAEALAELGDAYVLDAFSILHREHASVVLLPRLLPSRLGMHAEREARAIRRLFTPRHPYIAILGGVKLSTKLPVLERLVQEADSVLVGGAMFFTLMAALGLPTGGNPVEEAYLPAARRLLKAFGHRIRLPVDGVTEDGRIIPLEEGVYEMIRDIGPATRQAWARLVRPARMVLWNGPLGMVEKEAFREGTRRIARAIPSRWRCYSLVGGGDTLEALRLVHVSPRRYAHASSAGGALLHYLARHTLPGLEAVGWQG